MIDKVNDIFKFSCWIRFFLLSFSVLWVPLCAYRRNFKIKQFLKLPKVSPYDSDYISINCRSSHRRCSIRKGALRNFAKFKGKHLYQSLFLRGLGSATLLKKRLWHRCFPVNFAKFLRTQFLQNTSGRLLLELGRHIFHKLKYTSSPFVRNGSFLQNLFPVTLFHISWPNNTEILNSIVRVNAEKVCYKYPHKYAENKTYLCSYGIFFQNWPIIIFLIELIKMFQMYPLSGF